MPNASELLINIVAQNTGLKKTLNESKADLKSFGGEVNLLGSTIQGVFQGIGQSIANGLGNLVKAGIGEIGKSIRAASDLSESVNKVGVAFGAAGQGILEWSKTSATSLGQSQQQALEAASSFGLLFNTLGVGQNDAANMSKELVQLATDMASINNIPIADALQKLRSGLVGESEPLRSVGVLLSEAAVAQEAVTLGLASSTKAVDEQSKVLARYQLILDQTVQTQGDFARTASGIANQERILAARIDNLRASFGQAFTPIYAEILKGLNILIGDAAKNGEGIIRALAEGMVNGIIYLLPVLAQIRSFFTYWFEAHSPPKLLPDLAKWGASAMNAYLQGWTTADFGALRNLGGSIEGILRSFVGAGKLKETDLVSTIFGSTDAIATAVDEFRRLGTVSASSLEAIRRAAGPAGDAVSDLVGSYFELERATKAATDAQRQLDDVTRLYDARLGPINAKLSANQARQQQIRDNQRLEELGKTIADPTQSVDERRLARLEQEEILLRQQQTAVEKEKNVAVDGAKQKLDAATKEQQAKQEIFNQNQAALDQQVKVNSLLGEEAALRQRLADEAIAQQKQALAELEAEKRKADAADKERLAELERVYQAQLQYNLQIADTPGKIALMRLELGRYKEGSAEYYGILTQIASLEQQLAKERDKAGAGAGAGFGGIIPDVADLKMDGWASDLADKLDKAINAAFQNPAREPLSVADILRAPGDVPEVSQDIKDLVESLKGLTTAIGDTTKAATDFGLAIGLLPDKSKEAGKGVESETVVWLKKMTLDFEFYTALFKGDWGGAWDAIKERSALVWSQMGLDESTWLGGMLSTINQWAIDSNASMATGFTDLTTKVTTWLGDTLKTLSEFSLGPAAEGLLFSFYTGLSDYWNNTIAPWWEEKTKWIADLLPGSEPKNPQSPLRGLADRGEALMGNLQRGMETGASAMQTSFSGALGNLAGATTTNTTSNHLGPISIVFQGPVSDVSARSAARVLDDELRRRGFK